MLLAPVRGEPPREVAERLRAELGDASRRERRADRGRRPRIPQPVPRRPLAPRGAVARCSPPASGSGRPTRATRSGSSSSSCRANPTGPLTAAAGRGAAFGDSLARLLERAGHAVEREYYLNDAGGQVRLFAALDRCPDDAAPSRPRTATRATTSPSSPTSCATGARIRTTSRRSARLGTEPMRDQDRGHAGAFRRPLRHLVVGARAARLGPRSRRRSTSCASTATSTSSDGAVWLRTTEFGDDKDRVLIRSDGEPTYFAADIAYHLDKLERGADRLINVLGADHHGYVPRMRAALAALGLDPDRFEAPIMQLVQRRRGRRAGADVEAQGRLRHASTSCSTTSASTRRASSCFSAATTRRSTSTSIWRARHPRTTPSTTSSTRTRGSPASCARRPRKRGVADPADGDRRGRRRAGARRRRGARRDGRSCAACSSFRARSRRRPSGAPRTASAPTRRPPRPTFTPSIAMPGRRRAGARSRGRAARALPRHGADDRGDARAARRQRAGTDVSTGRGTGRSRAPAYIAG